LHDEGECIGLDRRLQNAGVRSGKVAKPNIRFNCLVKEHRLLLNDRDLVPELLEVVVFYVDAVDNYLSFRSVVEP